MKRLHIIYIVTLLLTLAACDNMRDDNGELGGMWQMTTWRDTTTRDVRDSALYYSFQCELMKIQSFRRGGDGFFLAYFTATADSLVIRQVYQNKRGDHPVALDRLQPYGVPADGRFRIRRLTSDELILEATGRTLTFRKY